MLLNVANWALNVREVNWWCASTFHTHTHPKHRSDSYRFLPHRQYDLSGADCVLHIWTMCRRCVKLCSTGCSGARSPCALARYFCAPCATSDRSLENDVAFRLFFIKKKKNRSEADVQPLNYAEAGHLHSLGDTWLLLPQNQSTENRINLVTIAQTFL